MWAPRVAATQPGVAACARASSARKMPRSMAACRCVVLLHGCSNFLFIFGGRLENARYRDVIARLCALSIKDLVCALT